MNKHKIKHIIKSYLAPMIFSFVPVLSHFIIGLYMMKQENTANLGFNYVFNFMLIHTLFPVL